MVLRCQSGLYAPFAAILILQLVENQEAKKKKYMKFPPKSNKVAAH